MNLLSQKPNENITTTLRSILLSLNLAFNILHSQTQSYFYCSVTHIQRPWEIYLLANCKHAQPLLEPWSLSEPPLFLYSAVTYPSGPAQLTFCKQLYLAISGQRYFLLFLCLAITLSCINYISCVYVLQTLST